MSRNAAEQAPRILNTRPTLPVLRRVDVVVVGGGFAGVAAALILARAGRNVVLVEPRTYLGREMTATLRPWIMLDERGDPKNLPEPVAECIAASGSSIQHGEIGLKPNAIKVRLEDLLLNAGVDLIYASLPVELLVSHNKVTGLIIANKSGRQVITCRIVIDATAAATVARVAGAAFEPGSSYARFSRTLEFDRVGPIPIRALPVPEGLDLAGNHIRLHAGYRGDGHVLVESSFDQSAVDLTLTAAMQRETEGRHRTMRLASHLIANVPEFSYAFLGSASRELHGPHTARMTGTLPTWAERLGTIPLRTIIPGATLVETSLSAFAGPVAHFWCLNEAARLDGAVAAQMREPISASLAGIALATYLADQWQTVLSSRSQTTLATPKLTAPTESTLMVSEPESPQPGRDYERYAIGPSEIPVLTEADVLVVGGGSSGATAAITSAQEGIKTVLLEMNPDLGGTGTVGGVDSYWFGRRTGFAARVSQLVEKVHDSLDYEGRRWNIEAKQFALLRASQQAGVALFCNTLVTGAVMESDRVRGVTVATRYGPVAVLADVVIDATGDGDIAAFAGAEFLYGDARDHSVMWYSLAQFNRPGRSVNNFTSMVDVSNIEDYTRAILAGRRRGQDCHDHGIYVAPRESRHILADEVLTLTDQLRQRQWPDVVNIHFSNHDIKGHTGSDWIRQGLIPPNLAVEIPYRVLLPKAVEGLLVTGKAISATHDALPAIRMQADLENLGGVTALAAAQAVHSNVTPRQIDVTALQHRLVTLGLLPDEILARKPISHPYTTAELERLVKSLDNERPLYAYSDMEMDEVFTEHIPFVEICSAGPRAIPILERELGHAEGVFRMRLAQALAMLGSQAGVPVLIDVIERALAGESLPVQKARIRHSQLPPDQGAMPDVAYLIYALGMARDSRSLDVWRHVSTLLAATGESMRDKHQGVFYYVDAVCFGAERLGDPRAIAILERLHAQAVLHDQVSQYGFQADCFLERQAMLELALGRALARCGSPEGLRILVAYLQDARALLAEQAHAELKILSEKDFGKNRALWMNWLSGIRETWRPRPLPIATLDTDV